MFLIDIVTLTYVVYIFQFSIFRKKTIQKTNKKYRRTTRNTNLIIIKTIEISIDPSERPMIY